MLTPKTCFLIFFALFPQIGVHKLFIAWLQIFSMQLGRQDSCLRIKIRNQFRNDLTINNGSLFRRYQSQDLNMCGIWAIINRCKLTPEKLEGFEKVKPRGPDHSIIHLNSSSIIGFHRLAINDLSSKGEQPFCVFNDDYKYTVIANGEIYNHLQLREQYGLDIDSRSDCAVILPLFMKLQDNFEELNKQLHGEYAIFITREHTQSGVVDYFAATDPLSVRPLFYYSTEHEFGVSSLLAGLSGFSKDVRRLDQGTLVRGRYSPSQNKNEILEVKKYTVQPKVEYVHENIELYENIVKTFKKAVEERLMSDRPIGCLLSGGLDSSLVASVAAKLLREQGKTLRTFSIGMKEGTDIIFARQVAQHINSDHTEFIYQAEQGLESIKDVIAITETFDITTIRASVGQYLIAKRISEQTDIKVVLNGDGADECQMGYLYFYLAPNAEEAKKDRDRLVQQIHLYDGLRVDRNISHFGLQARVPFLDEDFVNLYYKIAPQLIVPTPERMEKHLIRRAFEIVEPDVLPKCVLWRKKEAFSDGVSSKEKSWYQMVRSHVTRELYPSLLKTIDSKDQQDSAPVEAIDQRFKFEGLQPVCVESQYYRLYHSRLFNSNHQVFPHYWLPSWANTNEPSARVLSVYENKN